MKTSLSVKSYLENHCCAGETKRKKHRKTNTGLMILSSVLLTFVHPTAELLWIQEKYLEQVKFTTSGFQERNAWSKCIAHLHSQASIFLDHEPTDQIHWCTESNTLRQPIMKLSQCTANKTKADFTSRPHPFIHHISQRPFNVDVSLHVHAVSKAISLQHYKRSDIYDPPIQAIWEICVFFDLRSHL